jgi:hypothetical protein
LFAGADYVTLCRIGIGVSANGMMQGPSNAISNAVICSPANNTIGQFQFVNASFAGIVPDNTAGTTNMSWSQANGQTIMTWSRNVNNGNPSDAQVSTTGLTWVMWAIGKSNDYNPTHPAMSSVGVPLVPVVYANTVTLTSGLVLNWNLVGGSRLDLQAVYSGSLWCVFGTASCGVWSPVCVVARGHAGVCVVRGP